MGRLTCSARSLIRFFWDRWEREDTRPPTRQLTGARAPAQGTEALHRADFGRHYWSGPEKLYPSPVPTSGSGLFSEAADKRVETGDGFRPLSAALPSPRAELRHVTSVPTDTRNAGPPRSEKSSQVESMARHHFVNENGHSLESAEGMAIVLMPLSSLRQPGSPRNSLDPQALRPPVARGLPLSRIPFPGFLSTCHHADFSRFRRNPTCL